MDHVKTLIDPHNLIAALLFEGRNARRAIDRDEL